MQDEERDRLNRRLKILDRTTKRDLRRYRNSISTPGAVRYRGERHKFHPTPEGGFFEGADVIRRCHEFLDARGIAADASLSQHPKG